MRKSQKTNVILALLILYIYSASTSAATTKNFSLTDIVELADYIVVGRCTAKESSWNDGKIVTLNQITVVETVKGLNSESLKVLTLGGDAIHPRLNTSVSMKVPGGVSFDIGEKALLFLKKGKGEYYQIIGLTQGKLIVESSDIEGKEYISAGYKVFEKGSVGSVFLEADVLFQNDGEISKRKMLLDEMLVLIQEHLQ